MNENKSIAKNQENELELGKYMESDMIALTDDEVFGGITPTVLVASAAVTGFISANSCPTTACTRAC